VPRSRPPDRLSSILTGATKVFAARGLKRTQMADIAAELGVSPGTLYNYVAGKEALFHWCVLTSIDGTAADDVALPLPDPEPGATLEHVQHVLKGFRVIPPIDAALKGPPEADVGDELGTIIGVLYDGTALTRWFQQLIERSAAETPELFDAYYVGMRRKVIGKLTTYLTKRAESGHLRPTPDPPTTARLIIETVAWFANHRHGDLDSRSIDDDVARATVIDVLVHGLKA
jgi:AcrR family transcriptional regulator